MVMKSDIQTLLENVPEQPARCRWRRWTRLDALGHSFLHRPTGIAVGCRLEHRVTNDRRRETPLTKRRRRTARVDRRAKSRSSVAAPRKAHRLAY